jgi:hypothetical protein
VLAQRYLLCIGLLTLAGNIVNTGGNYIRDATVFAAAETRPWRHRLTAQQIVVNYMAGMDFWQNILAMTLQFFLVSRIFKYFGIGGRCSSCRLSRWAATPCSHWRRCWR